MTQTAELTALATALSELLGRVTALAEASSRDEVAAELYEVERTLGAAQRRLTRLIDRLESGR